MSRKRLLLILSVPIYGVLVFFFLTALRMPLDIVIPRAVHSLSKGLVTMRVRDAGITFPGKVTLEDAGIRIRAKGSDICSVIPRILLDPEYGKLLTGRLSSLFFVDMPAGSLEGRMGFPLAGPLRDVLLSIHTEGFQLERMPPIQQALKRGIRGDFSGHVNLRGNLKDVTQCRGDGVLVISDGSIGTRMGLPGLEEIPFRRLELSYLLKDGEVDLEKAEMEGDLFSGSFQGKIMLEKTISRSRLSMKGILVPGEEIRANAILGQLIGKAAEKGGSIPVSVRGTLKAPRIVRGKS